MTDSGVLAGQDSAVIASTHVVETSLPTRVDGLETRQRLLETATRLFARDGFRQTSIRALAEVAEVNVAAVRYYFGDKAGLYRAAVLEPMRSVLPELSDLIAAQTPIDATLRAYYRRMLTGVAMSPAAREALRLQMREVLEPTGLRESLIKLAITPRQAMLNQLVAQHTGLTETDPRVQRLGLTIVSLAIGMMILRVTEVPAALLLLGDEAQIEQTCTALAHDALNLIQQLSVEAESTG